VRQQLCIIGSNGEEVAPALISTIDDDYPMVRRNVVGALSKFGGEPGVVAALCQALEDADPEVINCAILALGLLGPQAEPSVPGLIKLLDNEIYYLRGNAISALGKIGPKASEALPKLRELSETDELIRFRESAKEAISKIEDI